MVTSRALTCRQMAQRVASRCQCGEQIAALGEERGGVMNALVQRVSELALRDPQLTGRLPALAGGVVSALRFGPVHSRGKRCGRSHAGRTVSKQQRLNQGQRRAAIHI